MTTHCLDSTKSIFIWQKSKSQLCCIPESPPVATFSCRWVVIPLPFTCPILKGEGVGRRRLLMASFGYSFGFVLATDAPRYGIHPTPDDTMTIFFQLARSSQLPEDTFIVLPLGIGCLWPSGLSHSPPASNWQSWGNTHAIFYAISGAKRALPYPARMLSSRSIAWIGKKVITYYFKTPFFPIPANLAVFFLSVNTRLKTCAG